MNKNAKVMMQASCFSLMILAGNSHAASWQDAVNAATNGKGVGQAAQTLNNARQLLGNGQQAAGLAQTVQSGSLTELLMNRVGVTQTQAQGGAGALLQIAKSKMQGEAFSRLGQSVPGIQGLLGAAPALQQPSALGGIAGQLSSIPALSGGTVGNLLSAASAFQQLGMSPAMIQQFVPVVVDYVKANAGDGLSSALSSALLGQ